LAVPKFQDFLRLLSVSGLSGLIAAEKWGRCNEGFVERTVHLVQ